MSDIEVHISQEETNVRAGTLYRQTALGRESVTFAYHEDGLVNAKCFSFEPGLHVGEDTVFNAEANSLIASL